MNKDECEFCLKSLKGVKHYIHHGIEDKSNTLYLCESCVVEFNIKDEVEVVEAKTDIPEPCS